jgi:hypothetical protein
MFHDEPAFDEEGAVTDATLRAVASTAPSNAETGFESGNEVPIEKCSPIASR